MIHFVAKVTPITVSVSEHMRLGTLEFVWLIAASGTGMHVHTEFMEKAILKTMHVRSYMVY